MARRGPWPQYHPGVFSHRTIWERRSSDFAARLERIRGSGRQLLDLTESNPTRCGLEWDPAELGSLLGDRRAAAHEPPPHGSREARAAVARYLADRGAAISPDRVFLAPSTIEACGLLFNVLCDPGDEVLVPLPSHPTLDRVAELESVLLTRYALRYDGEWRLDRGSLAAAVTRRTRAVVVSSPSSPTGALLSSEELAFLADLCSTRGLALIGDEAFADTALRPAVSVAGTTRCLSFHLSSLSGVCGLPQLRAAWMSVAGPEPLVQTAVSRLATLADTYLSISRPAELALPALLERRERFLGVLRSRLTENRARLATASLREAPWSVLQSGGGWWAVLEIGAAENEEALCLALLERDGVVVEPGVLYDFERSGYLVVSLLPGPDVFREGIQRLEARLRGPLFG
jgi:alanine-synthesizing transaminase